MGPFDLLLAGQSRQIPPGRSLRYSEPAAKFLHREIAVPPEQLREPFAAGLDYVEGNLHTSRIHFNERSQLYRADRRACGTPQTPIRTSSSSGCILLSKTFCASMRGTNGNRRRFAGEKNAPYFPAIAAC